MTRTEEDLLNMIRNARAAGFRLTDAMIRDEIQSLDDRQAEAMTLYWLHERTQEQVAAAMGITQPRVSQLLEEGAANLAACIANLALEHTRRN